ncbi:MAG: 3-hydroxyacyl-CoA dehydrogenase [Rhodospirillaceae bacterium]|jgi:L-gulonate 3-dehydrogenase|nr:3-hydroxyacyl-CoA dehydrogenase [Rhodospirillaceae bacterium]MBT6139628.1 3-hydroxyacyl-CoA dehydrogenase [Rhodospirillaceae bacterium]
MTERFAVVGAGLIGRAWAMVFARAGREVRLHDADSAALSATMEQMAINLKDLETHGLIPSADAVAARVHPTDSLEEALDGAIWVQENIVEKVEPKREIFAVMDAIAAPETVLASSSSAIAASHFTEGLAGRARCLIAHPVNPPYLVPLVEICPAPWTDPATVERGRELMDAVGMVPTVVNKEIEGFILNRLQGALLCEAFKLVADGYVSAEDVDKTIKDGLGLRWSFMGPLETIDLNAPGGIRDYLARYGPFYERAAKEQAEFRAWDEEMVSMLESERRDVLPADQLGERQVWRDKRLMALLRHKAEAAGNIGS